MLTNRISELSGTVKANGQTVTSASVVLFPEDPALWVFPSRRVRTVRVDQNGVFRASALPPGERYLALAVDYLEQGEFQDPLFLERMKGRGTAFSLNEGENKNLDLTLVETSRAGPSDRPRSEMIRVPVEDVVGGLRHRDVRERPDHEHDPSALRHR